MVERFQEEVSKSREPSDQGRLTVVDLIHEFPYRNSGIEVTRDLESLHRELPVTENRNPEIPKRSTP
jgi:hypothetical protein